MPDNSQRLEAWQARGEPQPVRLIARNGSEVKLVVYRCSLRNGERAVRAFTALGICWALAAVTILIPVAHFVLVPGFLLAGPIAAWVRYRPRSLVLGGVGACPGCEAEVVVPSQAEHWPLSATCDGCMESLELREA